MCVAESPCYGARGGTSRGGRSAANPKRDHPKHYEKSFRNRAAHTPCPYARFAASLAPSRIASPMPEAKPFIGIATGTRLYRSKSRSRSAQRQSPLLLVGWAGLFYVYGRWMRRTLTAQWNVLDCPRVTVQNLFCREPVDFFGPVIIDVGITDVHRAQVRVLRFSERCV